VSVDVSPRGPTLEQVAKAAGVSRATVSRVINGSPSVSPRARQMVQLAVRQLGYVPNTAARALVTQRTNTIALVVSEPSYRLFTEPFYETIIRSIDAALADADMQLVFALASTPQERARFERFCSGRHIDGALLLSLHEGDPFPEIFSRTRLPAVLGGRPPNGSALPFVDVANQAGAQSAVEHLRARGRRRIGTITGPTDTGVGNDRLDGYLAGLGPLRAHASLIVPGDFTRAGGERAMARMLEQEPHVDAVFCASDLMAVGAMDALAASGRRIPDDVAVVGYDDSDLARYTVPPLTTVRQPTEELGRELVRLLLALVRGDDGPRQVLLPTQLIVRQSS
jgi:DNA-binding LacI/PurR family transcriptional regulator